MGYKRESLSTFCMRHSRLNYGRVPGWVTVFNGNLKVAAVGGGFKKINTYKKVAKVYYWLKHSLNLGK